MVSSTTIAALKMLITMVGIISLPILIFYLALGIHLWWSRVFEYLGPPLVVLFRFGIGDMALLEEVCH